MDVQGDGEEADRDVGVPDAGDGAVGGDCGGVGAGEEGKAAHGAVVLRACAYVGEAVGADEVGAGEDFWGCAGGPADYAVWSVVGFVGLVGVTGLVVIVDFCG